MARVGVLLANTGTPDEPTPRAVRRYLKEFLADPRMIELPRWLWLPILHGVVLRVRPRRSAALYARTWTDRGSPLRFHSEDLAGALQARLGADAPDEVIVRAGMRYGQPGIRAAMADLLEAGAERIVVLPMFPQSSGATTGSILDGVFAACGTWRNPPAITTIADYHDHPAYLDALAESIEGRWAEAGRPSHLVLSFHGIPMSYHHAGDRYATHCERTAQGIVERLGLAADEWTLAYQSRFGPQRWLEPATVDVLAGLAATKPERVDVVCPGFAVDCLETVDEMGREARHHYQAHGGGAFGYLPALNATEAHVRALARILAPTLGGVPTSTT